MYVTTDIDLFVVDGDKGINVNDCRGIVFFTAVEGGGASLHAEGGATADDTQELAQTKVEAQEGTKLLALDIHHPMQSFVKPVLSGGSGPIFAIKYLSRTNRGSLDPGINRVAAPLPGVA